MPEPTSRLQRWILESQLELLNRRHPGPAEPVPGEPGPRQPLQAFLVE
jgi:hypothetical protein